MAFGWILYAVSGGFPEADGLGIAKVVPVLLAVIAVWAAMVEEEAIVWTMGTFLVFFGIGLAGRGGLPVTWAGVGLLVVMAISKIDSEPPSSDLKLGPPRR